MFLKYGGFFDKNFCSNFKLFRTAPIAVEIDEIIDANSGKQQPALLLKEAIKAPLPIASAPSSIKDDVDIKSPEYNVAKPLSKTTVVSGETTQATVIVPSDDISKILERGENFRAPHSKPGKDCLLFYFTFREFSK